MAAVSTMIAAAALTVSTVGVVQGNKNQKKALQQQEQAQKYTREQNDLQAARQRRDTIRQARMAYAQSQATSENQGVSGSSIAMGALGSIVSQGSENISFLDRYNFLSDQAGQALGKAYRYEHNANSWNSVSNLAMNVFQNSERIANVFGQK